METTHQIFFKNSNDMSEIESNTIDLIITSPPYPMIGMWDSLFSSLNKDIGDALQEKDGKTAFRLMHDELDKVWVESVRVIKEGGFACINIGDATRSINNNFQLFTNHVRISNFFQRNGFFVLPCILWRKPTNSPTKFMGSGMIPPNAYITLEHEYILIFRKGENKREFPPKSEKRYNSAYFWEERNKWFSDIWTDIQGTPQKIKDNNILNRLRERSAAFPFELPFRLINMFSIYGDIVLDPFWGTGTTTQAAMMSARNSIGYEIKQKFMEIFKQNIRNIKKITDSMNNNRLQQHIEFIKTYEKGEKEIKYMATNYNFRVITSQERDILLYSIKNISQNDNKHTVEYKKFEYDHKSKLIQSRLKF